MSNLTHRWLFAGFTVLALGGITMGSLTGCSSDEEESTPGTAGSAGTGTGGASTGGASNGGTHSGGGSVGGSGTGGASTGGSGGGTAGGGGIENPLTNPNDGPPAGNQNPEATCDIPEDGRPLDVSNPTTVVGTGTKESCTSASFVSAVANGGVITFNCGADPMVLTLDETAKVFNHTANPAEGKSPNIVIDGKGLVTLSGAGARRILYMNTCDEAQGWTTPNCDNQDHPLLTLQNITFIDGNAKDSNEETGWGGAVYASGGRLKLVNTRFFNNVGADVGQDVGGGAVRAFQQYNNLPVYVVNSTFGGAQNFGGACSNGGGISSIGVSWTIINSLFSYNRATGNGGNPREPGTPGGGSGGAIYNDGNEMTLNICGTRIENNQVNAYGAAIFFVSNNHTGNIIIDRSVIQNNTGGSWYPVCDQISTHSDTSITVTNTDLACPP